MKMLRIKKEVYDEMIEHCKNCLPYEACGILAGKNDLVTKIYKIRNIESSSITYFMETTEQFKAMKNMREQGLEMLGIFHSHPCGDTYPSQKDIELAFYDVYYVIVSIQPKCVSIFSKTKPEETQFEVKCFKIVNGNVNEEELITE